MRHLSPAELAVEMANAPSSMANLPRHRGYPVPFFVHRPPGWVAGDPVDFRMTSAEAMQKAIVGRLCWITGTPLGRAAAFIGGPVSAITLQWVEPPSRVACAIFAARVCPFMLGGGGVAPLREGAESLPGEHVSTQTGVTAVVVTRQHWMIRPHDDGVVFTLPAPPDEVLWFKNGQRATRAEIAGALDAARAILDGYQTAPEIAAKHRANEALLRGGTP